MSWSLRPGWCCLALALSLIACAAERAPACLPGDQVQCRCAREGDAGTLYGYRTCAAGPDGGVAYGQCACVEGLLPNLGSPLSTPYMSGNGSGNGADAGAP